MTWKGPRQIVSRRACWHCSRQLQAAIGGGYIAAVVEVHGHLRFCHLACAQAAIDYAQVNDSR